MLLSAATATAQERPSPFDLGAGVVLSGGATLGINSDDEATDFTGSHPYLTLQAGYRFSFGTEPFVAAGFGVGGHESLLVAYGGGLRQRVKLGRVEPYVEAGLSFVGDEADTPLALSVGAGLDLRLGPRLSAGIGGGHHFSADGDDRGALDWYARGYLAWDLPF